MDAEIKTKWVEALRSGKYRQGQEALQNRSNEFCCLGVLCDVRGAAWGSPNRDGWREPVGMQRAGLAYLNDSALEAVGLAHQQQLILADLNDNGSSFSEIADYIEANL